MRTLGLALVALLGIGAACGGSSADQTPATPAAGDPPVATRPEPSAEDKLVSAQASAVHAMCERLVDQCAVEDAKASLSPEEAAQNTAPEVLAKLRDECEGDYGKLSLSPRQIKVIQRCVNEAQECPALGTCLGEASQK